MAIALNSCRAHRGILYLARLIDSLAKDLTPADADR
jgi:hypothetical protein